MLGVWLFGGVLAFAGAMAYAELAALRPRAGGEYVYLRDAYGRVAAFLTGWTSFVAGFSGAIAASAVGARRLHRPLRSGRRRHDAAPDDPDSVRAAGRHATGLVAITRDRRPVVRSTSTAPGRLVHNFLAGLKVSALLRLHRARPVARRWIVRQRRERPRRQRAGHGLAAGADPGDVQLFGLERRRLRRRGDPRSGPQRAAWRSRLGTLARRRRLPRAERAVSLRDAARPNWRAAATVASPISSPSGCSDSSPATCSRSSRS